MNPGNTRRVGRPRLSDELNPLVTLTAEERRSLFLEKAAELFEDQGYASTSIEDITECLGLSKGIFYYYWKSKKEILLEIHARAVGALNTQLDEVMRHISDPGQRVTKAIESHLNVVMRHRSLVAVLLGEAAFSEETIKERRAYTERIQHILEDAIQAGVIDPIYQPKILAFALLGLLNSVAQWYQADGPMPASEITAVYLRLAMQGCQKH
ncbi:MAG: hypothetical protein C7B46_08270 [Sulfobacillus benefaciens]|uniref:HTH tetR-type domain-containing protein n=1 Tax=Sulfobacillus benefaciens TaxID=453960 RepID=A0A2T2XH50_9FIRM|nr:MAG: hypothetical protein C7B46_08270 [Sulfobacillus benefaciens]